MVVRHDSESVSEGGGSDPQVVGTDELAFGGEGAVDFAVVPGDFHRPRQDGIRTAQALPIAADAGGLAAREFTGHGEGDEIGFGRALREEGICLAGRAAPGFALGGDDEVGARIRPLDCRARGHAWRLPRRHRGSVR